MPVLFDPENKVVSLCAAGMEAEAKANRLTAAGYFSQAWNEAITDFEKFTAAHYMARCQQNVTDKLKWDKLALRHALEIKDQDIEPHLPSLYLNIGKCHEDLGNLPLALLNYELANTYSRFMADDGYGKMIRSGIANGIRRMAENS